MKRELILKVILVLTIISMLFAMSINVYAEPADLGDIFVDQGSLGDIKEDPAQEPEQELEQEPTPTQKEEELPEAGLAEDTMRVVTIAGLVILATVAYKKVNEYQNI